VLANIRTQLIELRRHPDPDQLAYEEAASLLREANEYAMLQGLSTRAVGTMVPPAHAIATVSRYLLEIERTRSTVELVTPFDAAKLLNISERTLWKHADMGEIPRVKIGTCVRYHKSDLLAFIESKK